MYLSRFLIKWRFLKKTFNHRNRRQTNILLTWIHLYWCNNITCQIVISLNANIPVTWNRIMKVRFISKLIAALLFIAGSQSSYVSNWVDSPQSGVGIKFLQFTLSVKLSYLLQTCCKICLTSEELIADSFYDLSFHFSSVALGEYTGQVRSRRKSCSHNTNL